MKKIISIFILGLCISHSSFAGDVSTFTQAPKGVFTPKSFDDNDDVIVVLSGVLGNFCFKTAPSTPRIDLVNHKIYIENKIYSVGNCANAMLYIPYSQVVNVGILPHGTYTVLVSDGNGGYTSRASIPVAVSKASAYSPDDSLYAPVSEVQFTPAAVAGQDPSITLRGTLSNSCLSVSGIEVNVRPGSVVEILPHAVMADSRDCTMTPVAFAKTVTLSHFPAGDVLLHVRSMGGQSVNRVITFLDRFHVETTDAQ